MTEMRIPRDAKILMVGHSLGGAEACNLAADYVRYPAGPLLNARRARWAAIHDSERPRSPIFRYVMQTAVSDLGLIFVDSGGRNTIGAHVAYPYSAALRNYDAYGDQDGPRYAELDAHNMCRCEAKKEALNYPVGNLDSGFDRLALYPNSQGRPPAGSPEHTATVAWRFALAREESGRFVATHPISSRRIPFRRDTSNRDGMRGPIPRRDAISSQ